MKESKENGISAHSQNIETLNARLELEKQNVRFYREKLDSHVELIVNIHNFCQKLFSCTEDELVESIPEGLVDIFELEIGIYFTFDMAGQYFTVNNSLNLDDKYKGMKIPADKDWLKQNRLFDRKSGSCRTESPIAGGPLKRLQLEHAIFMPVFDVQRKLSGLILGGISAYGSKYYRFEPEEIGNSFVIFCQQTNGILNNLHAVGMAKSANEAKTRFLANLSHEIRTPMNAITGMVQIAERSSDPEQISACIRQIDISSQHLLQLLNDVLDFSKIEEGKMQLSHVSFSVEDVLQKCMQYASVTALKKNIKLSLKYDISEKKNVIGDSLRLSQVILNLLSNAVKFTGEDGSVTLCAHELSQAGDRILLRFSVSDTGIGISREASESIFSPFVQADNSTSRKYGGTGLGLSISQRIVEMMGGSIKVESEPGKGSEFYFSVWLDTEKNEDALQGRKDKDDTINLPEAYDFSGKRVLIVDDVEINRIIMKSFLDGTGIACDEAADGREAVDMFTASNNGYYDLILMDVQMPVMDGLDATRMIRSSRRKDSKTVKILALTANVFKEDMQLVAEAGMDGHIGKPASIGPTLQIINSVLK